MTAGRCASRLLSLVACWVSALAAEEQVPAQVVSTGASGGTADIEQLLGQKLLRPRTLYPDWLRRIPRFGAWPEPDANPELLVVLQRERPDGAELVTLRHGLADMGALRTYVGAGLNRAVYFAETDLGETRMTGRNRHRSLGAAAEIGAELAVTRQLRLTADLRWIDLAADAGILRGNDGLVAADPVSLGLSLGWRFR